MWQPFPPLTWFIPMIGHTGITDSKGIVHDFQVRCAIGAVHKHLALMNCCSARLRAPPSHLRGGSRDRTCLPQGPYTIIEDNMMLGRACRYLPLDPSKVCAVTDGSTPEERWDACIEQGDADFRKKIHCLLYPNCNHHVAHCLNCCKVSSTGTGGSKRDRCPMLPAAMLASCAPPDCFCYRVVCVCLSGGKDARTLPE